MGPTVFVEGVGAVGPPGPAGEAGPPGTGGGGDADGHYTHLQAIPAAVWTISHGLGWYPNVTVVDSSGRIVEGDIEYVDVDTALATFAGAFSGSAFCS